MEENDPPPPQFPQLRMYLMDGLLLNQKINNNIRISYLLKNKHSKNNKFSKSYTPPRTLHLISVTLSHINRMLSHSVIQGQSSPLPEGKKILFPPNFSYPCVPRILIPPPQVKFFQSCYFQNLKTNFLPFGSLHFAKLSSTTNINN